MTSDSGGQTAASPCVASSAAGPVTCSPVGGAPGRGPTTPPRPSAPDCRPGSLRPTTTIDRTDTDQSHSTDNYNRHN